MSNTVIKITNINSWLLTSNSELKHKLWSLFRFRDDNCFYNKLYKEKKWDGYNEFFNKKNGLFLTGLLPEVQLVLKKLNIPHSIIDERNGIKWLHKSINADFLNSEKPESFAEELSLHDYQPDLVNKVLKNNRGIIKAPTGAGKTFIMVSILKCLPPKTPVLFVTKNKSLVDQNYKVMKEWNVPNVGRWYGKHKEPNYIMCVTSHKKTFESIKPLLPKFKVLIVDEVHDCMSKEPIAAFRKMKNACVRIGVSATPFKDEKTQKHTVKGHFGPIFKTSTTKDGQLTTANLQKRGMLSPSKCIIYPIDQPNNIQYEPYLDSVTLGIAENYYLHGVIKRLSESLKGRTLILVERRMQGEYLHQLMPNAHWINGDDSLKVREPVIEALIKDANTTAIVMRQIITAGIDVKVHNIINASGGDAVHNLIQQIGRGLRNAEDKDILKYYDFLFRTNDYLEDHSNGRIKTLRKEGHEVIIKDKLDF